MPTNLYKGKSCGSVRLHLIRNPTLRICVNVFYRRSVVRHFNGVVCFCRVTCDTLFKFQQEKLRFKVFLLAAYIFMYSLVRASDAIHPIGKAAGFVLRVGSFYIFHQAKLEWIQA